MMMQLLIIRKQLIAIPQINNIFRFIIPTEHKFNCLKVLYFYIIFVRYYLGNYGRAIDDCVHSLENDSQNIKSYFRMAKAQFELRRYEEALSTSNKGIEVIYYF
jgi:tetratricopeptide (TPR) repeat protein